MQVYEALILYGPPAAGKDTVTDKLVELDARFLRHRRLKVSGSRAAIMSDRYRMTTLDTLEQLTRQEDVLYRNERYGNIYAFVRSQIAEDLEVGVPILHVGQIAGIRALREYQVQWLSVSLWCSRKTAVYRAQQRGSTDVAARLVAWDETKADLAVSCDDDFHLRLNTDELSAEEATREIYRAACREI